MKHAVTLPTMPINSRNGPKTKIWGNCSSKHKHDIFTSGYTGVKLFHMSKALCAMFWKLHSILFLPISPLECNFQNDMHWTFDIRNNLTPILRYTWPLSSVERLADMAWRWWGGSKRCHSCPTDRHSWWRGGMDRRPPCSRSSCPHCNRRVGCSTHPSWDLGGFLRYNKFWGEWGRMSEPSHFITPYTATLQLSHRMKQSGGLAQKLSNFLSNCV